MLILTTHATRSHSQDPTRPISSFSTLLFCPLSPLQFALVPLVCSFHTFNPDSCPSCPIPAQARAPLLHTSAFDKLKHTLLPSSPIDRVPTFPPALQSPLVHKNQCVSALFSPALTGRNPQLTHRVYALTSCSLNPLLPTYHRVYASPFFVSAALPPPILWCQLLALLLSSCILWCPSLISTQPICSPCVAAAD